MANKKYWQSFSELTDSEHFHDLAGNEFKEELPVGEGESAQENNSTSRRDFLKYLGFSTAAAAIAASCETPVNKAIPYLNKPADIIPGMADYYATTFIEGGEAIPVVAKVRDGRPIKVEGNTLSSVYKGGTSARVQASVLDLYDTARLRFPKANGNAIAVEELDKQLLQELGNGPVVLLTSTITSPSAKQIISEFLNKYPGSRHVQYDSISYSGLLNANQASFGIRAVPSYKFNEASVVVSLGADFLGTWINPVEYQKLYAQGRKLTQDKIEMSKHYQFESFMSMTGSNADERFTHKPSETGTIAMALLNAVSGNGVSGVTNEKLKAAIEKVAADLNNNRGKSIVVSGSNDTNIQLIVNAINAAIGSYGSTIDWSAPLMTKQGNDAEFNALVADMNSGAVNNLFIYGVNPAYDYYNSQAFVAALGKVRTTVAFASKQDETAELCKYIIPVNHYLESWGDAEVKPGYFSLIQPTIAPLFKTRQFEESLLVYSGSAESFYEYHKRFWTSKLGSSELYQKALQDGVVEPAAAAAVSAGNYNGSSVSTALTSAAANSNAGGIELVLYQNVAMGDGSAANNPWLQELPDPITKATWDNYIMISPKLGKEILNIDIASQRDANKYEVHPKKDVLKLTAGDKTVELPALIIPGMHDDTVAIAVGYGRKSKNEEDTARNIGRAVVNVGQNVFGFAGFSGGTVTWNAGTVTLEKTGRKYEIAQNQTHNSYEGRLEVIREVSFDVLKERPNVVLDKRAAELAHWGGLEGFREEGSPYPLHDRPGIHWGMSIDLNSCFGCGACVVACTAENNVPVVGKSEVLRFHDMHWLRIDRYFSGDPHDADSIQTVFQPMLCQHCDNAPCENVCPVAATNHSNEGINQMVYNRCIGTRYCANNCPYKVRRFNWADYTGADSFKNNQKFSGVGKLDDSVHMMNEDLTRMVLNPDVTVRSRGVIEKCSFCIQRLQEGKLKAKKENRVLTDEDATTACAQACPADAIVFGNVNSSESAISKTRRDNNNRIYFALEQIHTLPNVNYLAKVRNADLNVPEAIEAQQELPEAAEHH